MKKQMINLSKALSIAMFATTLLTIVSCNTEKGNQSSGSISSTEKKETKAPTIDIHAASFMGNIRAIKQHVEAGTDLNQKDSYGSTPLIIATLFGKTEVALILIEAGADINLKNSEESTPLHTAAFFCRTEIVKALLANGADKTLKNNAGATALESVSASFIEVKGVYDFFGKELGPLGLKLDYQHLETTRPLIAEMLR